MLFECKYYFPELLTILHQQLNDFTLLSFCHNYYPRPDTGLSVDLVNKKNELIYQFNPKAQIYGFIVGSGLRGPLHKGLPTIEATRHSHPVVAAKLLQETGVSEVLVGDALIEMRQAKQLIDFCKNRHFTLCIEEVFDTTVTYLFDMCHKVRRIIRKMSFVRKHQDKYVHIRYNHSLQRNDALVQ